LETVVTLVRQAARELQGQRDSLDRLEWRASLGRLGPQGRRDRTERLDLPAQLAVVETEDLTVVRAGLDPLAWLVHQAVMDPLEVLEALERVVLLVLLVYRALPVTLEIQAPSVTPVCTCNYVTFRPVIVA